jgi:hypothetical protein
MTGAAIRVLEVLGRVDDAAVLASRAADLIDWAPESWWPLSQLAAARLMNSSGNSAVFWERVQGALDALVLDALPQPEHHAADAGGWWNSVADWCRPIGALLKGFGDRLTEFGADEAGWATAQVAMRAAGGAHSVYPPASLAGKSDVRVFVVDPREPEPVDMTSAALSRQPVWELEEAGDEIRIIVITNAPDADSLSDAIAQAKDRPASSIQVVRVSRPK